MPKPRDHPHAFSSHIHPKVTIVLTINSVNVVIILSWKESWICTPCDCLFYLVLHFWDPSRLLHIVVGHSFSLLWYFLMCFFTFLRWVFFRTKSDNESRRSKENYWFYSQIFKYPVTWGMVTTWLFSLSWREVGFLLLNI